MTIIVIDTETTGLEPGSRLVELAALRLDEDYEVAASMSLLVNPRMPIPADAIDVHGIDNVMVASAAGAPLVLAEFLSGVEDGYTLAMHNAPFDATILAWECARTGMRMPLVDVIDTLEIARKLKQTTSNDLETIARHFELCASGPAHRAMTDADLCRQYLRLTWPAAHVAPRPFFELPTHTYVQPLDLPAHLSTLPQLVESGRPLSFGYIDAKDNRTDRTITPYGWAMANDLIYVHGWCHKQQARRTFRADRMDAEATP